MKLSIIINIDSINQDDLNNLYILKKTQINNDVDVILYGNLSSNLDLKDFVYYDNSLDGKAIIYSIISSSGKYLFFVNYKYLLKTGASKILKSLPKSDFNVASYVVNNRILNIIGIRLIKKTPLIITSYDFAKENAKEFNRLDDVIKKANKLLKLHKFYDNSINNICTDCAILKRAIFFRPYLRIIVNATHIRKIFSKSNKNKKHKTKNTKINISNLPVFIICRDRVTPLKKLIDWLVQEDLHNIYFIDNNSTYAPLINYYKKSPYPVIRLTKNMGQTSPWDSGAIDILAPNKPFIVSDPDILPNHNSHGAIKFFQYLLNKYPKYLKVGFGLKIDDLPNNYDLKKQVIKWEQKFWEKEVELNVYDADIDTTFALYRPSTPYLHGPALRTGGKYIARHEPWYMNSNRPNVEMIYYRNKANKDTGSWGLSSSDISKYHKNVYKIN